MRLAAVDDVLASNSLAPFAARGPTRHTLVLAVCIYCSVVLFPLMALPQGLWKTCALDSQHRISVSSVCAASVTVFLCLARFRNVFRFRPSYPFCPFFLSVAHIICLCALVPPSMCLSNHFSCDTTIVFFFSHFFHFFCGLRVGCLMGSFCLRETGMW
jgi:hypothetical protein